MTRLLMDTVGGDPGYDYRYSRLLAAQDCDATRLVRLMALRLGGSAKQHDGSALLTHGFA